MQTNFLVIGSGISGLNFALHAAKKGHVILITKKKLIDSATNFAQGGIAAVLDKTDDVEKHIADTMKAGDNHNDKKAVRFMVENSRDAIYRLIDLGVQFEKEKGNLALTQEGGHNKKRIAYVGDYTGHEIERILIKRVKEHLNITVLENAFALSLISHKKICYGAQIIHKKKIDNVFADQTILATGGIGQAYKHTTNPKIATGDGIAMAIKAGCKMSDMEFIQFHPTALAKKLTPLFLISETVRGEGGKLINSEGKRFTDELKPRSIVAREIYKQDGPVFLDITHKPRTFLKKRFPKIYKKLKDLNIDMAKDRIPVTPAAHYLCGGVKTNLNGQTSLRNLFAFGEVTCTGVHGANRLASNSLLEALVFSNQIAKSLKPSNKLKVLTLDRPTLSPKSSKDTKTAQSLQKSIKKLMWKYAGIVRKPSQIKSQAIPTLKEILAKLENLKSTNQTIAETRNITITSLTILEAAAKRKKTLGCHYV